MSITLVLVLLIGSLLTACGGAPAPVVFSSLPVFTGATESTNDLLTAGLQGGLDAAKADTTVQGAEGKVYGLPDGTTFDAIAAFYKTALEKDGWTLGSATAPNLVYARGKQALTLVQVEAVNGLVVVLTTLK
jgi:hypothetical protein